MNPPLRIGVFRALQLGDWLCATPALSALRKRFPRAQLTLIGLRWTAALAERLTMVDRFLEFPGHWSLPEQSCTPPLFDAFLKAARAESFDCLLQMHGSGPLVNSIVAACHPKTMLAFSTGPADRPCVAGVRTYYVDWPTRGSEIERCLSLVAELGADTSDHTLSWPLRAGDWASLAALEPSLQTHYIVVHTGAQLPSRRWLARRFAELIGRLAEDGHQIVLTGTAAEARRVNAIQAAAGVAVVNLVGRTSLWQLGALVARARLLICNDTGLSHVAAATGTPSVVIASGSEVSRWAPLDRQRHHVLAAQVNCRPCSVRRCPTGHECAKAIELDDVLAGVSAQLRNDYPPRADKAYCMRSPLTSS